MTEHSAAYLKNLIEDRYRKLDYRLGWRLLYSPESVIDGARIALVGLNPGGSFAPADHAEFAMPAGSAYVVESWAGHPPGCAPLQRRVCSLLEHLGVSPEEVLAGNLVPFRSPSWRALPNKRAARSFGAELWSDLIDRAQPELVICMGGEARRAIKKVLDVRSAERVPLAWGKVAGEVGSFSGGRFVGLPHLSRFGVVDRPESQAGLKRLFGGWW